MSLNYTVQNSGYFLGSEDELRTLTNSYADNTVSIPTAGMSVIELYIAYTPAENNAVIEWKLDRGPESDDVYQETYTWINPNEDGTQEIFLRPAKFTGEIDSTTYKFVVSENIACKVLRASFKETATSHGQFKLRATISGR